MTPFGLGEDPKCDWEAGISAKDFQICMQRFRACLYEKHGPSNNKHINTYKKSVMTNGPLPKSTLPLIFQALIRNKHSLGRFPYAADGYSTVVTPIVGIQNSWLPVAVDYKKSRRPACEQAKHADPNMSINVSVLCLEPQRREYIVTSTR